jgi:hypothetical protein
MQVDLDLAGVSFEGNELKLLENIGGEGAGGAAVTLEFANGHVNRRRGSERFQVRANRLPSVPFSSLDFPCCPLIERYCYLRCARRQFPGCI